MTQTNFRVECAHMAIELLDIGTMKPEARADFMFAVGRQEDMDGRNGEALRQAISSAITAGLTVEAHREMNTNAILELTIGDTIAINKYEEATKAEKAAA